MAIAASVVVRPSLSLLLAQAGMSCLAGFAAAALIFVDQHQPAKIENLAAGLFSACLATAGVLQVFRSIKTFHLDISGIGQIRLTQYSGVSDFADRKSSPLDEGDAAVVQLMKESTLWPHLLMLRLKSEHGAVFTVPVLPDGVSGDGFRELSVACRWIAARAADTENQMK
jgi:toxin CptA